MTSTGYHDTGEEWAQKRTYRQDLLGSGAASIDLLLYEDATDQLSDADDIGSIGTEPTDGNYARQTVSLDSAEVSLSVQNGDLVASGVVSFDTTDTTGTVDAYASVVTFQSDVVNSESSANEHLHVSSTFESGNTRDLSKQSSLDIEYEITLN